MQTRSFLSPVVYGLFRENTIDSLESDRTIWYDFSDNIYAVSSGGNHDGTDDNGGVYMTIEEKIAAAGRRADQYWQEGYHCSEATFRAVSEILAIPVTEELRRVSSVFQGGGGGFGGRCGVVEAGLMLIGLLYGRDNSEDDCGALRYLAQEWQRRFMLQFVSLNCSSIKPYAQAHSEDHSCRRTYVVGAERMAEFLLDAPALAAGKAWEADEK